MSENETLKRLESVRDKVCTIELHRKAKVLHANPVNEEYYKKLEELRDAANCYIVLAVDTLDVHEDLKYLSVIVDPYVAHAVLTEFTLMLEAVRKHPKYYDLEWDAEDGKFLNVFRLTYLRSLSKD